MPTSLHQTPMHSPSNLPIMAQHSAYRLRIPTTVCAASRFATLMATSCSSADPGNGSAAIHRIDCEIVRQHEQQGSRCAGSPPFRGPVCGACTKSPPMEQLCHFG